MFAPRPDFNYGFDRVNHLCAHMLTQIFIILHLNDSLQTTVVFFFGTIGTVGGKIRLPNSEYRVLCLRRLGNAILASCFIFLSRVLENHGQHLSMHHVGFLLNQTSAG